VLSAPPPSVCCYECHVFSATNEKKVVVSQGSTCLSLHKEEDEICSVLVFFFTGSEIISFKKKDMYGCSD